MKIVELKHVNVKNLAGEIKKGKIIVSPTDTVYGLIADASNKEAVGKVFKIKKRPRTKPLPIFVKNLKGAKKLAEIDKNQEKFLKRVWPGKTTAVLKRKKMKTKLYGLDKETVALRIPNYKLFLGLAKEFDRPLTGTSANVSGWPASGNIKEILKQFEGKKHQPDLIIDAGNLKKSKPSKVVDLTGDTPKILRRR